jgi:RHS repeat-associated protein
MVVRNRLDYTGAYYGDSTQLLYLRARHYAPGIGHFITSDPSRTEANLFQYASSNPINRTDATGLNSDWLIGPMSFALCFDFHSISHGWSHDADVNFAIQTCRYAFSKDKWNPAWFDFTKPPESAHDLMGWYLFEQGSERMWFDGNSALTKELAKSTLISDIRLKYYLQGDLTGTNKLKEFGHGAFIRSILADSLGSVPKASLPISFFLGSFKYQVVTLPYENKVGFRIDNRTDLESGTHIAGRFPGGGYHGSVEELLARGEIKGGDLLFDVIHRNNVISILQIRTRQETSNPLGGGNLEQVYTWTEERNDCFWWMEFLAYVPDTKSTRVIDPWPDYWLYTQDVQW